jgi:hypothetical protein
LKSWWGRRLHLASLARAEFHIAVALEFMNWLLHYSVSKPWSQLKCTNACWRSTGGRGVYESTGSETESEDDRISS